MRREIFGYLWYHQSDRNYIWNFLSEVASLVHTIKHQQVLATNFGFCFFFLVSETMMMMMMKMMTMMKKQLILLFGLSSCFSACIL